MLLWDSAPELVGGRTFILFKFDTSSFAYFQVDDFASYPFITPVVYLLTETFGLDLTENFFMPISFSGFVVDSLVVFVSKLLMLAVAVVP